MESPWPTATKMTSQPLLQLSATLTITIATGNSAAAAMVGVLTTAICVMLPVGVLVPCVAAPVRLFTATETRKLAKTAMEKGNSNADTARADSANATPATALELLVMSESNPLRSLIAHPVLILMIPGEKPYFANFLNEVS